ncbi:hypothetical protein ACSSS7_006537 [Eimeria intestinalis]
MGDWVSWGVSVAPGAEGCSMLLLFELIVAATCLQKNSKGPSKQPFTSSPRRVSRGPGGPSFSRPS